MFTSCTIDFWKKIMHIQFFLCYQRVSGCWVFNKLTDSYRFRHSIFIMNKVFVYWYHYIPNGMTKITKDSTNFVMLLRECKLVQALCKIVWTYPPYLNMCTPMKEQFYSYILQQRRECICLPKSHTSQECS